MVGYELKSGEEKWSVAATPSSCCSSPVVADGTLLFAGWSPGGADDKEFQMPPFDWVLKDTDTDKDGMISRAEADKSFLKDFFDSNDSNKDGKVSRDEWDAVLKFMTEGTNVAFAMKAGGAGDVTTSHLLWKKKRGLPYLASALAYRGQYFMVKDGGLITAYLLFVMRIGSRRVHLAGCTTSPDGLWMKQVARNLTNCEDGFLNGSRHLLLDRDTKFTAEFQGILKQSGVEAVLLPPRSPNLNAHLERSIKDESLSRLVFFGERSLRNAVCEYLAHYHAERNHQGLKNRLIDSGEDVGRAGGEVQCRERLGGMLRYYYRDAA